MAISTQFQLKVYKTLQQGYRRSWQSLSGCCDPFVGARVTSKIRRLTLNHVEQKYEKITLHTKQDLNPFSRFWTPKPSKARDRQTYWQTWTWPDISCIRWNLIEHNCSVFDVLRSALVRHLLWRRGCLCVCVCLSVTLMYCSQTTESIIIK